MAHELMGIPLAVLICKELLHHVCIFQTYDETLLISCYSDPFIMNQTVILEIKLPALIFKKVIAHTHLGSISIS